MDRPASGVDPATQTESTKSESRVVVSIERVLALVRPLYALLTLLRERSQTGRSPN